jgi:hypothetical protein
MMRTNDAAKYLGLTAGTLRTYRMRGCGPHYYRLGVGQGAPVGYRVEDLDEWLKSRRFSSTSEEVRRGAR